jgi:hypothetical protein
MRTRLITGFVTSGGGVVLPPFPVGGGEYGELNSERIPKSFPGGSEMKVDVGTWSTRKSVLLSR